MEWGGGGRGGREESEWGLGGGGGRVFGERDYYYVRESHHVRDLSLYE